MMNQNEICETFNETFNTVDMLLANQIEILEIMLAEFDNYDDDELVSVSAGSLRGLCDTCIHLIAYICGDMERVKGYLERKNLI